MNKVLEISDSIENQKEIRIYKDYSIGNRIILFRMFNDEANEWIVQKFWYQKDFKSVTKIDEFRFPKEAIGKLKPKNAHLIWLNLLLCNVEYLTSQTNIDYKLKDAKIVFEDGEFGISKNKKHAIDGESYRVFIKNETIKNEFSFDNPSFYLKYYPTVDELISYNELLSVIKKDFDF
ncbi:hypothetical protein [Flavobacterium phragmitis]|nr:hypothetical protein [Flavobacterium phragmitis]